jgi:hypothetical protein
MRKLGLLWLDVLLDVIISFALYPSVLLPVLCRVWIIVSKWTYSHREQVGYVRSTSRPHTEGQLPERFNRPDLLVASIPQRTNSALA